MALILIPPVQRPSWWRHLTAGVSRVPLVLLTKGLTGYGVPFWNA